MADSSRPTGTSRTGATAVHRQSAVRRTPTSARLAHEARQQRIWYLGLFTVIGLIVVTLVGGALFTYVIGPATPAATVNGTVIRTDTFQHYQKWEGYLLRNQQNQLQQLASQPGAAQYVAQQQQTIQGNINNIQAYTLQQMEQSLEEQRAAAAIGAAPTPAQLQAEFTRQATRFDKQSGPGAFQKLIDSLGVSAGDMQRYFFALSLVEQAVTKHFQGTAPATQHWAKARHILVGTKLVADRLARLVKANPTLFGRLARQYSTDNGLAPQPGTLPVTGTARLLAQGRSSAFNGGWLADPSPASTAQTPPTRYKVVRGKNGKTTRVAIPAPLYQPTWLTPLTSYVKPVLNAVLTMKPREVRIAQSQFGYHVIRVEQTTTHHLSKQERTSILQTNGQQGLTAWRTAALDPTKNEVSPSNPYAQFPQGTPTGQ